MSSTQLLNQFRFNQMTLTLLLKDVSEEESYFRPAGEGNCINYIVGHLIGARGLVLKNLGISPDWLLPLTTVYGRGKHTFPEGAQSLAELNGLLKDSFGALTVALPEFEPRLAETCTERMPHLEVGTWADRIGSFACHEAYHCGQIGLARRALGKPGLF